MIPLKADPFQITAIRFTEMLRAIIHMICSVMVVMSIRMMMVMDLTTFIHHNHLYPLRATFIATIGYQVHAGSAIGDQQSQ